MHCTHRAYPRQALSELRLQGVDLSSYVNCASLTGNASLCPNISMAALIDDAQGAPDTRTHLFRQVDGRQVDGWIDRWVGGWWVVHGQVDMEMSIYLV